MATSIQFSRNLRKRALRMENQSVKMVKKVSKAALRELVDGTPVDKGVARSNWRVSIGSPTRLVIPAYVPGKNLGIGERKNAKAAISAGIAQINLLKAGAQFRTGQAGSALYIVNNIPYLLKLRNKYSPQQQTDWVMLALLKARGEIGTIKLLER